MLVYTFIIIFIILAVLLFIWLKKIGVAKTEAKREIELNLSYPSAFSRCLEVLKSMKAIINESDPSAGYIRSVLTSLKSLILWGGVGSHVVEIKLSEISENKTRINIISKPFGIYKYILVTDWGRNSKVIEQIVSNLS